MILPRPYFTSFFRFTVVISLSGEGKAFSFFFSESVQQKETFIISTGIYRSVASDVGIQSISISTL